MAIDSGWETRHELLWIEDLRERGRIETLRKLYEANARRVWPTTVDGRRVQDRLRHILALSDSTKPDSNRLGVNTNGENDTTL